MTKASQSNVENIEMKLSESISNLSCVMQEWDERVDCIVKNIDGTILNIMIPVSEFTEENVDKIKETIIETISKNVRDMKSNQSPFQIKPDRGGGDEDGGDSALN